MPDWADAIFANIIGPWGAVFVLCLVIYFLWKLFREEQAENRANFSTVNTQSQAIRELTIEVRASRAYGSGNWVQPPAKPEGS